MGTEEERRVMRGQGHYIDLIFIENFLQKVNEPSEVE